MLVSFVIPSHNCSEFLGAAVESVRNQTHKDLEIIIVNDASSDSTPKYLDWLMGVEPRAFILTNKEKQGRSMSRNQGNLIAKGKYIFVLDADDLATPNRVELTLPLFKKADFVHGGAVGISELNENLGAMITEKFSLDRTIKDQYRQSFIVHSTVAYTKEFSAKYPYSSGKASDFGIDDWDQQIRAYLGGAKFDFTPNCLAYYRRREEAISNTRNHEAVLSAKREMFPQLFKEAAAV
jgi:glycosyltransferase involved in cell wall biosynthesis